jgi:hypothetical protein
VVQLSLDSYFPASISPEFALLEAWGTLRRKLRRENPIFRVADGAGMLEKVEPVLRWSLRLRDAWWNLLEAECVEGCLSADDTNPYSRIPLLLAKVRGIPSVACHHGALDCWMAAKTLASDFYLSKSDMEWDYLVNQCHLARERIVSGGPGDVDKVSALPAAEASHIVFFTEPYETSGWRVEEIYQDILPRLYALAQSCGLKLVLKLHPFENIKTHRKRVCRILGREAEVEITAGPTTIDLWRKMKFAFTVQSSIALECAATRVPVFLCGWLRDSYSGYVEQYAKFGVGHLLETPEQISEIPDLLASQRYPAAALGKSIQPEILQSLFSRDYCLPSAINC